MSTTMSHAHSEHAPDQTQRQPQPQSRRSSSSSRSRARGLPSPRALLAAVAGVALLGMAGGLPSAAAALPGGRPAPRRGRPTTGRGAAGSSSGFMPPPPPPPPAQQEEQQQPGQQQPGQAAAAYKVQTRPWGPASGSYTYQRYYTSQEAAGTGGGDGRGGGGNEVLYPRIMRTVGNTGVCVLFMILTARATHLYELADQVSGALRRYLVTIPVVGLLCANLVGVLLSLVQSFSRNSRLKTRLKAILTLNGLAEVVMVAYNSVRLVLGNDKWTPREAYVGRIFTSIWILTICFAFSTSRWDNNAFGGQP